MSEEIQLTSRRTHWFWPTLFVGATFGTGALARIFDLSSGWSMIVMIPSVLLLIPLVRASEKAQADGCGTSVALRAYNRRFLTASMLYVAGLFLAIWLYKMWRLTGALGWFLPLLPAVPTLAMIWTMARYLIEESDEYLRHRAVNASLIATGILLSAATFWGFLETFKLVPHVPMWACLPLWAIGLGVGQVFGRVREA